jgi:hypothetical protein
MERLSVKKLNEAEGKEKYCVLRIADLYMKSDCGTITENMKMSAIEILGYYELRKQKLCFDERCSQLLGQRKQVKLQWLQEPSEINGNNQNTVRCEASTYFRSKKREYLKDRTNEQ